jgi:hypothetical protein
MKGLRELGPFSFPNFTTRPGLPAMGRLMDGATVTVYGLGGLSC